MGLTFIKGDSQQNCFKGGCEHLKCFFNQITTPVYIVVPDRASLVSENDVINNLSENGILNFDVITINKLARLILTESEASTVGRTGMLIKIKQIINDNLDKFKIYTKLASKNSKGFVDEVYETILQLKASHITPSDLENGLSKMPELLSLKMGDILLIYKAYEEFLTSEIFDGPSKLSSVISNIKFCKKIKGAIFWFAKSEALTMQAKEIISELTKYCREVYVSVVDTKLTNFYKELENKLSENASINFKDVKEIVVNNNNKETQNFIKNNLFRFNSMPTKQNECKLFEAQSETDELKFVASQIALKVKSGECNFNDINIAACNLKENEDLIKTIFSEYGIPINIDAEILANENIVTKFIFSAFEVLKTHFKADKVLNFAKNGLNFLNLSDLCDFENYIYKYGIDGIDFSHAFFNETAERVRSYVFNLLSPLYNEFVKSENGEDFMFLVLDFLEICELESRVQRFIDLLNSKKEFVEANITKLTFDKIVNIFNQVRLVVNKNSLSINNFFDILSLAINELKFNIAPVVANAVFVGDAFESYFGERKFLFIVGANENAFPRTKKDVGLIADNEILNLNLTNSLSPSVSEVNLRYLQRAYELLFFSPKTYLSFSVVSGGESVRPSFFFLTLKRLLIDAFKVIENDDIELLNKNQAYNFAIEQYNLAARGFAPANPSKVASLVKIFNINNLAKNRNELVPNKNYLSLAFNNNTISVSQLECYVNCPYKHYLKYVLKLKPQEKSEIDSLDTGNIIHRFVELFLKKLNINKVKSNLKNYAQSLMKNVLAEKQFEDATKNKINEPIIAGLINEAPKIAETLITHFENANFKPIAFEQKLGVENNIKINDLNLIGKIDRIDKCESVIESEGNLQSKKQQIRIIDYKTGGSTTFKYTDIYYGNAMQLPIYSYILSNNNCQVVGLFYLLIRNKFNGKQIPKLNGVVLNDLKIIKNMDLTLHEGEKSLLLEIRLTKEGVVDKKNDGSVVSEKEMRELVDSSVELASSIIDEIKSGYIEANILQSSNKTPCDFCDYKNLSACKNCKIRNKVTLSRDEFFKRFKEDDDEL